MKFIFISWFIKPRFNRPNLTWVNNSKCELFNYCSITEKTSANSEKLILFTSKEELLKR